MTRHEAITAVHKSHHPEDFAPGGYEPPRYGLNRRWAEKAVDGYVALGMIVLDEPKASHERDVLNALMDACKAVPYLATCIQETLDRAGLKIVEK